MSRALAGFRVQSLYKVKRPHLLKSAKDQVSVFVAAFTLVAFIIGNMVGQHGWYAFWRGVMGKEDDTQIVFTGTVPPIEFVPNYECWAKFGGGSKGATYNLIPQQCLIPLPSYDPLALKGADPMKNAEKRVYSIGNLGSYATGDDHTGSHTGMDIAVPLGTPIRAIANGIVDISVLQEVGYGHHVMIRHPNVPDSDNVGKTTTVYSVYAHMSDVLVTKGQVINKGQIIGYSGQTGFASGPHLHFQIDKDFTVDAAKGMYHPYWVFTTKEATEAHMSFTEAIDAGLHRERGDLYTLSPMLFVQQYEKFSSPTMVAQQTLQQADKVALAASSSSSSAPFITVSQRIRLARDARIKARVTQAATVSVTKVAYAINDSAPTAASSSVASSVAAPVVQSVPVDRAKMQVDHIEIRFQDSTFGDKWVTGKVVAYNKDGEKLMSPFFTGNLALSTSFGSAKFIPQTFSMGSFAGRDAAVFNMLGQGPKSVIVKVNGVFNAESQPLTYKK